MRCHGQGSIPAYLPILVPSWLMFCQPDEGLGYICADHDRRTGPYMEWGEIPDLHSLLYRTQVRLRLLLTGLDSLAWALLFSVTFREYHYQVQRSISGSREGSTQTCCRKQCRFGEGSAVQWHQDMDRAGFCWMEEV